MIQKSRGFTIVELLIVIVVIAILAAISATVYGSVARRANNTAIINAVSGSSRLIGTYLSTYGTYPLVASAEVTRCVLADSGCQHSDGGFIGGNSALIAEIGRAGVLPKSAPFTGELGNGIFYQYTPLMVVNGESQPLMITYWLDGAYQSCGVPNVLTNLAPRTISLTGYTVANEGGKTRCSISVPGPAHLL